jgi:toxin ParE1/3/4
VLSIIWRRSASDDLATILAYIANEDPQAARRLKERVESAVLPLAQHPYLYRHGRVPGTREVVIHPNYILVYRIDAECIEVVSVLHSRQEYP